MKIGIVSNDDLSLPLIQFLKSCKADISVLADPAPQNVTGFQAAAQFCAAADIPVQQGRNEPAVLYEWIGDLQPDILFIMGYRHLIDTALLSRRLHDNTFNIHFGALPGFRGANPVFWQLRTGHPTLDLTIHRINDKFDAGPIIWTKQIHREPHFSYGLVNMLLSHAAIEGALYILNQRAQHKELPVLQPGTSKPRYYPRPVLKDVLINWNTMEAQEVINLVQACNPWNKGAITLFKGNEIKILDAVLSSIHPEHTVKQPGGITWSDGVLQITCAGHTAIDISMLSINDMFVPARHADKFGFLSGERFG